MTAACCASPASGNCYWPCLKAPGAAYEAVSFQGRAETQGGSILSRACSAEHFSRATSSRYAGLQTQSWILLLRLNLPHQRQPSRRPPRSRQSRSCPAISLSINRQAGQFQRHLRRSAFDGCSSGRFERHTSSSGRLKFSPARPRHANAAMRSRTLLAAFHGQSSAWGSVAFDRAAKPAIGPAGFDRCKPSGREKRWWSLFASAIAVHPFAQFGSAAHTPCFARVKIRHLALFHENASPLEGRHFRPNLIMAACSLHAAIVRMAVFGFFKSRRFLFSVLCPSHCPRHIARHNPSQL